MPQTSRPKTVIVAGSGIVGAAVTYFLVKQGVHVELLDAHAPAAEATGAADGAVSVASKRPGPMMNAALAGVALYRSLAGQGLLADLFKARSTYIVAASDAECEILEAHAAALAENRMRIERMPASMVREKIPVLSKGVRLVVEVKDEGHAIGYQIVHRLLTASGVVVRRGHRVNSFLTHPSSGAVCGVRTDHGDFSADAVVIAAGSGSAGLMGLDDVMFPRKGQLLVTERASALNQSLNGAIMSGRYLMSKGSQQGSAPQSARGYGLVIDPLKTGQFLIGGTREDHGDRCKNDIDAVSHILRDAVGLLPGLAEVRLLRAFAGNRTAVVDGLPLIGKAQGHANVFVATGFEGDGICLGPVMGKAISQLVCGETPDVDLTPFDPGRFADRRKAA